MYVNVDKLGFFFNFRKKSHFPETSTNTCTKNLFYNKKIKKMKRLFKYGICMTSKSFSNGATDAKIQQIRYSQVV